MLSHYSEILKGRRKRMARAAARTDEAGCSNDCVSSKTDIENPPSFDEQGMLSHLTPYSNFPRVL